VDAVRAVRRPVPDPPETAAVVDELRETDVTAVSPLELMSQVQSWQERLD